MNRKIYLASSWRNAEQARVLAVLRKSGHEVYDFKNPAPGNEGFHWSEVDREWLKWTPEAFAEKLSTHPVAASGFALDKRALDWCDMCVLLLPCGRSAHLEAGYACGQRKTTIFYLSPDRFEPELMYLLGNSCVTNDEQLLDAIRKDGWHHDGVDRQNVEFDACAEITKQYRRITMTPPVDDDYPSVRHDYEHAVDSFLRACRANGRRI